MPPSAVGLFYKDVMAEEKDTLELQEREASRLCDTGFHFTVNRRVRRYAKGIRRCFTKPTTEDEELRFEVLQPTLNTLDRVAPYMLRFQRYTDRAKEAEEADLLEVAKSSVVEARNMAKIIAIMVLGEAYHVFNERTHRYEGDDAELKRIEEIMFNHITPTRLYALCEACLAVANLADFMNSIRLMGAETESVSSPRKSRVE